jgi:hypothetical protein
VLSNLQKKKRLPAPANHTTKNRSYFSAGLILFGLIFIFLGGAFTTGQAAVLFYDLDAPSVLVGPAIAMEREGDPRGLAKPFT